MKYDSAMEYYKDEATSAREIAKRKFLANDIAGAKKYAMKAQFLYPELDGIGQMVATFVVHFSVQNIILGGIDYYGILGLNFEADDETVRKRYKKLVVMLHPDKNKSVRGKEAFQCLSQAWVMFSNKAKRAEYDLKRNVGLYEGGWASSSRPKASSKTAKVKSSMRGRQWASEASAATSTSAYKTSAGGVVTGNKDTVHAAQTGSRKDEVMRIEYNKRVAGVSSTLPPKRRKVMENAVAGATNNASCSAAKTKDELQELRTIVAETETETDANGWKMETGDVNGTKAIESCCIDSTDDISVTEKYFKYLEALTIDVPGPDFCDFDKDRSEKSFTDNQIWSCYDIIEGMPRSYVMIDNVISVYPFKVRISRLILETNGELNSTKWLCSKSYGDFRVGKTQICNSPYMFSHNVNLVKANHEDFVIYPRKGDVWALFRNWSPDFDYLTDYEIVEVVEGYTEENGVLVVPLIKVAGFKAVFHHHLDPEETRRILKDEISRFSDKIPSYLLTCQEAPCAPRGCIQLDPAAIPSQLFQVIQ